MRLVRGLAGLRNVAADGNSLSPPDEIHDLTASLATELPFKPPFSLPRLV